MAENSGIGWTTHTMNFWWGCNKVSDECTNCYIDALMRWQGKEPFNGPIRTKDWSKPLRWNRKAAITGERPRIFTCSMSDFFHPGADEWRSAAWEIIRACQNLDWLILTKRPELIPNRLPSDWGDSYGNVCMGGCGAVEATMVVGPKLWATDECRDGQAISRHQRLAPHASQSSIPIRWKVLRHVQTMAITGRASDGSSRSGAQRKMVCTSDTVQACDEDQNQSQRRRS